MSEQIIRCQQDVLYGDPGAPSVAYCNAQKGHTGAHIGYPMVMWFNGPEGPETPEAHYKRHKA